MWKLRIGALVTSGVLGLTLTSGAWASQGRETENGDVWVSATGQPTDTSSVSDPHLPCQDVNVWTSGLAGSEQSFTIDDLSGSAEHALNYSGAWTFSQQAPGDQAVAAINIAKVIKLAQNGGDTGTSEGFHFRLDIPQHPDLDRMFWVDCPSGSIDAGSSDGAGGSAGGGQAGSPAAGTGADQPGGRTTDPGKVNLPAVTSTDGPVKTSIGAVTAQRRRTMPKASQHTRRLATPTRHRNGRRHHRSVVRRRHVKTVRHRPLNAARITAPRFAA